MPSRFATLRMHAMFLAYLASKLAARKRFVWRPAIRLDDSTVVSTLMGDLSR